MKPTFAPWLVAAALALLCPLAEAQQTKPALPPVPAGFKAERDINYGEGTNKKQALDLYFPEKSPDAPLPLLIYIHGGGWLGGDKAFFPARALLEKGYAVASVNYRFSNEAIYPAQLEDCKAAVRWLRAHADQYHFDKDRFGVWGDSAGGHLVALLGTAGDVKELEGHVGNHLDVSSRVQCVVDWFGPTDMTVFFDQAGDDNIFKPKPAESPIEKLFGGPASAKPDLYRLGNPVAFVTPDDPPFLIMHGDQDKLVPLKQSEMLCDALKKAGVEVELVVLPGGGHGGPAFAADKVGPAVLAFLDKHLKFRNSVSR